MDGLKQTELWKNFESKADKRQQVMVEDLVTRAAERLDLVRDTFPTYTLHNRTHALNVVQRMGDLLQARIDQITALEGALLLLSAYCHDIGMVFTEEERQNLSQEQDFDRFLRTYPQAYVTLQEHKPTIPVEIAEQYCRWTHARRVHRYLAGLDDAAIRWGVTPLRKSLGAVCESHVLDITELQRSDELDTDFLGEADLLFCAIILRLADILDFDNTRSPDEVYRYLGLKNRNTQRKTDSDIEWRKHLYSEGFRFPQDRSGSYELKFIAAPDHPAVEHDVRAFLDIIEAEMTNCYSLLRRCAPKWQPFDLPGRINRDNIYSQNYKYGPFRFTLEQEQILNLLMGENLYSDPYVFVRELVQNAIDTVRHRVFYEHSHGNMNFQPQPITVSTWHDKDGYQWVRFDDYGMGMNEDLITSYLLRVGKSYYQSAQFKAETLRYSSRESFVPISRFGIGLLSCFMVGDRIELSTRRLEENRQQATSLRFSMSGLQSFFTLCVEGERHPAPPMPNERGREETYRREADYGTSIAVRLDPRKEHARFDLAETLNRYVLCSPIPILYQGEPVGGDYQRLIATPWIAEPLEVEFSPNELAQIEETLGFKFTAPPKIKILPLDLTKHSLTPELSGQAVVGFISISEADQKRMLNGLSRIELRLRRGDAIDKLVLSANFRYQDLSMLEQLGRDWGVGTKFYDTIQEMAERLQREARGIAFRDNDWNRLIDEAIQSASSGTQEEFKHISQQLEAILATAERQSSRDAGVVEARKLYNKIADFAGKRRQASRELTLTMNRVLGSADLLDFLQHIAEGQSWLSHNGVCVPMQYPDPNGYSSTVSLNPPIYNGWISCKLFLRDSLRPNVSLARDVLKSLSWQTCSQIALAFYRAFRAYDHSSAYRHSIFQSLPDEENYSLGEILSDPNMDLQGAWAHVPLIATDQGKMSVEEIRQHLKAGKSVRIDHSFGSGSSWTDCCIRALIQIGLDVRLSDIQTYKTSLHIISNGVPVVPEGLQLFPPLSFVSYEGSKLLRKGRYPYNLSHPFARWLIDNAPTLSTQYPGLFESIRVNLSSEYGYNKDKRNRMIEVTNKALARLRQLNAEISPAARLDLKAADFES